LGLKAGDGDANQDNKEMTKDAHYEKSSQQSSVLEKMALN